MQQRRIQNLFFKGGGGGGLYCDPSVCFFRQKRMKTPKYQKITFLNMINQKGGEEGSTLITPPTFYCIQYILSHFTCLKIDV